MTWCDRCQDETEDEMGAPLPCRCELVLCYCCAESHTTEWHEDWEEDEEWRHT